MTNDNLKGQKSVCKFLAFLILISIFIIMLSSIGMVIFPEILIFEKIINTAGYIMVCIVAVMWGILLS